MGESTKIQWTDHTANFWWGCTKVHAGCTHCYAETWDKRYSGGHWGNTSRRAIKSVWGDLEKWNRDAMATFGRPARVFACSMCDLFEDFDGPVCDAAGNVLRGIALDDLRERAFAGMEFYTNLEFQVLTKRAENITRMVPQKWLTKWPANVMTGTSPCNQDTADVCIPALLKVPGRHFLSMEPLIGPVDLRGKLINWRRDGSTFFSPVPHSQPQRLIDWVIVGGESGHGARHFDIGWARQIVAQCKAANVPVFVKQFGGMPIVSLGRGPDDAGTPWEHVDLEDKKGGDWNEWPEDLRVREFPANHNETVAVNP